MPPKIVTPTPNDGAFIILNGEEVSLIHAKDVVSPTIIGGICDNIVNNPSPQGINNHTVPGNNTQQ